MKLASVASIGLLMAMIATFAPSLRAQDDDEAKAKAETPVVDKDTTRVTLGSSSGEAGTSIVVPIYFTPATGVAVGHITLDVTWVSANVKFDKVERGIAAEMGDVSLKSDLKLGKNDQGVETSTLTIDALQESPAKPIPSGLLGYISLKVNENGRAAKVSMLGKIKTAESAMNAPLKKVIVVNSIVEVFAPGTQPAVACFFFSH